MPAIQKNITVGYCVGPNFGVIGGQYYRGLVSGSLQGKILGPKVVPDLPGTAD